MSCSENAHQSGLEMAENVKQAVIDIVTASGSAVGSITNLLAKKIEAKLNGEEADTTLGDYANAVLIDPTKAARQQGVASVAAKLAKAAAQGNDLPTGGPELIEAAKAKLKAAKENADTQGDQLRGHCDPTDPSDPTAPGVQIGGRNQGGGSGKPPGHDGRPYDPLVLDLDGGGIDLVSVDLSTARLDMDGDGLAERVGWVGAGTGLLVLDANQNGRVDGMSELFGNATTDGFDVLRTLDSNADGVINSSDARFAELNVWRDANGNGTTEIGELVSLGEAGVVSISLAATNSSFTLAGNFVARTSTFTRDDGTTSAAATIWFARDVTDTRYVPPEGFEYLADSAWLPRLRGYGQVADLSAAISLRPDLASSLRSLVQDSATLDAPAFRTRAETLVQQWFQVDGTADGSRGQYVNYAHLDVIEKWFGIPYWQTNISSSNAYWVEVIYQHVIDQMTAKLIVQMPYASWAQQTLATGESVPLFDHPLSPFQVWDYDEDTDKIDGRMDHFVAMALDRVPGTIEETAAYLTKLQGYLKTFSNIIYGGDGAKLLADLRDAVGLVNEGAIGDHFFISGLTNGAVSGSAGADTITATGQGVAVAGGAGDDRLIGVAGGEVLFGGAGDDRLEGQAGNDIYLYHIGDGNDVVADTSGTDTIAFGPGISSADLRFSVPSNDSTDCLITFANAPGSIRLEAWLDNFSYTIERFEFADGTVWDLNKILEELQRGQATSGNDTIFGTRYGETLSGGAGNDIIYARNGTDSLVGGAGDDHLEGYYDGDTYIYNLGDGNDVVSDYAGNYGGTDILSFGTGIAPTDVRFGVPSDDSTDSIITFASGPGSVRLNAWLDNFDYTIEQIRFADGTVWDVSTILTKLQEGQTTTGDDRVFGTRHSETLSGGSGNDVLYARNGFDTLIGGLGDDRLEGYYDGDTYIYNPGDGNDAIADYAGNYGGTDIISFSTGIAPTDVRFSVPSDDSTDYVLTFANMPGSVRVEAWLDGPDYAIEQIRFADGTVWDLDTIITKLQEGQTTSGDDRIFGTRFSETLSGGDGNDALYARNGFDTLAGGKGDDRLEGYYDGDTYIYNAGDGNDTIADYAGNYGGTDIISFGAGISPTDVRFSVPTDDSTDSLITFANMPGTIRLEAWLDNFDYVIEQFRFADGTVWDLNTIITKLQEGQTTTGNDQIFGTRYSEALSGGSGNDVLRARNGFDTLTGGPGDDYMEGYYDGDVYVYNLGDGNDTIADYAGNYGGTDIIRFGPGISSADLRFSVPSNDSTDCLITFANAPGSIRLEAWLDNFSYTIERFEFADGTVWDLNKILEELQRGQATSGNDTIFGTRYGETLSGGAGNDTVYSRNGNDTLIGGTGDDRLEGLYDSDTYVYSRGDGNDVIVENAGSWGGTDILRFGVGIGSSDVSVWRSGADTRDIVVGLNDGSGSILLNDQLTGSVYGIEQVIFADGTAWSAANLAQMATLIAGDAANNTITGTASGEVIDGRDGNDVLNGAAGDDTLIGGRGDDTLNGGDGSDAARFSGRWFDYAIVRQSNGSYVVSDTAGTDGADTLTAIETATFSDRSFSPDALLDGWAGGNAQAVEGAIAGTVVGTVKPAAGDAYQGQMQFELLGDANGRFVIDAATGAVLVADGASFTGAPASLGVRVGVSYGAETYRAFDLAVSVDRAPIGLNLIEVAPGVGLTLNGYASVVAEGDYRLTPNVKRVSGAVWGEVDLSKDVTWTTKMFFGGADRYGADGMAFGLQNAGPNVLGGFGGVLPNGSFGIKFDTWANGEIGEPNSDFSQFVNNGVQGSASLSFDSYKLHGNLENGAWHDVVISWSAATTTLSYSLNGVLVGSKTHDVVAGNFGGDTTAYYGFGGITGGYANEHRVQIKSVESQVPSFTVTENAAAGVLLGKLAGVDPDAGDKLTYTLVDSTGAAMTDSNFEIVNNNELRVKPGAVIDFEAQVTHHLLVKVTDSAGASIVRSLDVNVRDALGSTVTGTAAADVLSGTTEADMVDALAGDDVLTGRDGDDRLTGGTGNDALDGGLGFDTAVYSGAQAGYSIATSGGSIQVIDTDALDGDEGTDTLAGVERAQFTDVTVSLATPIVLDLDGDGIELVEASRSKARFDFDGDGARDDTGWIGKGDGLLVLDRNANGRVDGAAELSFVDDRAGARSDLDGLRAHDSNSDGLISADDEIFAQLLVWRDSDRDGTIDKRELLSLEDVDIIAIELGARSTEQEWAWGSNIVVNESGFVRADGSTGDLADVAFAYVSSFADRAEASQAQAVEELWTSAARGPDAAYVQIA